MKPLIFLAVLVLIALTVFFGVITLSLLNEVTSDPRGLLAAWRLFPPIGMSVCFMFAMARMADQTLPFLRKDR